MIPIPGTTEIIVLLIIIGLIVLAIYTARVFKAAQTPFLMKWFCFYTYFLLPFWVICILAEIHKMGTASILPIGFIAYTLGLIALIVAVFIGLHKRKLWGWYLNWVLLAIEVLTKILFYPVGDFEKNTRHFASYLFAGSIYTLASVIYFRKRKVSFT
jgi:hypothetical protein